MVSSLKMEIEKFNGKIFELWKLKMEDLLVDKRSVDRGGSRYCTYRNFNR
jgi:hypothetical protein